MLEGRDFDPDKSRGSPASTSGSFLEPIEPHIQRVLEDFFLVIKRPERDCNHLFPLNTGV
jgi:hypothetical protein